MNLPEFHTQHVFFASGSSNDYLLFQQVVNDLPYLVHLSTAKDGDDTMEVLNQLTDLPDLLILDLDLSIKNGLECLVEIKAHNKLGSLPVVIYGPQHPSRPLSTNFTRVARTYTFINRRMLGS